MEALKKLLTEMVPVVLGILLALFIDDWKEQRNDQRFLEKVMLSVSGEVADNVQELERVIPQQQALADTLSAYLTDDSVTLLQAIGKVGGVKTATIKVTSWRAFLNSKLELLDYATISALSQMEEEKSNLRLKLNKMMDHVYLHLNASDEEAKTVTFIFLQDVLETEGYLLEAHEQFLTEH